MKTLEEQFGKLKPKKTTDGMTECYAINNYIGLNIIRYIVRHKCKLEHRSNLEKQDWKPGTLREFLHAFTEAYITKNPKADCFDNWTLNFWRIKTKPTAEEIEKLTVIENNEED